MHQLTPKRFLTALLVLSTSLLVQRSSQDETVLTKDMKFKLHNGKEMPLIGFGTYQVRGTQLIKDSLDYALGAGYKLIDSATVYKNEEDIGKALKELLPKHKLSREDIFITSKLSPHDQGPKAYEALQTSLKKLDSGYLDLYLIHWPGAIDLNVTDPENAKLRDQSWESLTKGVKDGLVKSIGVSNYNVRQLKELLAKDHGVKPAVNQVEWHPHYHQKELKDLCDKEGILLQAYSSLGGTNNTDLLKDPTIQKIATKLGKNPAQILLRWPLQENIAIIPKSRTKKYIEENIDLNFVIPEEDMQTLANFPQNKYAWDPDTVA